MVDKTVLIDSQPYPVYADVDDANLYMKGKFNNSDWFSALNDDETKARALITATRIMDKQCWQGESSALSGQQLKWPRTGITDVDDATVPNDIVNGCIELANLIITGSDVEGNSQPGVQTIQSMRAGSAALTFFRDAEGLVSKYSRFPIEVQELVGRYLCGNSLAVLPEVTGGTDSSDPSTLSVTNDRYGFTEGV